MDEMSGLLADLDGVVADSKSVFPGRVLLSRKKTAAVLDAMRQHLTADGTPEYRDEAVALLRAIQCVEDFDSRIGSGGYGGPSIWRIWFLDISRTKLDAQVANLREAVTAWAKTRAGRRPAGANADIPSHGGPPPPQD